MDDPGFWEWVKTPRSQGGGGLKSGDPIATEAAYNTLMREYLKSGGGTFQPTAVAVTNPVNTNQVVPMIMTSPGSAIPFPQPSFKEGRVDDQGTPLVFDDTTGMYFPATNRATRAPVKPTESAPAAQFVMVDGKPMLVTPGMNPNPTPTPTPAPSAASTAPMAAGAYETNMPVPVAAPTPSAAMSMGMAPTPAPAAAAPAGFSSVEEVIAAARSGQITKAQAQGILINQFGLDP